MARLYFLGDVIHCGKHDSRNHKDQVNHDAPILLRRMIGRAYPGDSVTHLAVDMLNVFFWAALAQIARDYAWRSPQLAMYADYLEYPVVAAFGPAAASQARAA